ncbi:ABC transporter ATP-binding protein [Peribacillus saganii]|uniref:ABC transporter ATP-binding protein n=1 Tax=Peribacillus saganii TaxID=2303992 RepID=A0A372LLV7_9BACI|nr:ABC transporter ATP-binding protein [Peribacillus saganii]RFU67461.1 ABC transporter ATP-binding protein [Peribacillus saganii]
MVVTLEDVSLNRNGEWILKNINWNVSKGEHWVIYGLNGAGKTALLNMICAYYFPTSGSVEVLGSKFGKAELGGTLRKRIGLVSSALQQKFSPSDSAFEIVLSGAYASIGLYEKPTAEIRERAISLLEQLGSTEYADRNYQTLSQGEKQRVLIARALMAKPELLILDEPAAGLDFIAREDLLEFIQLIAQDEVAPTLLYVTHHVEEILPIFDHALLLKGGQVFASGKTKHILKDNTLSDFFGLEVEVNWHNERPALSKRAACSSVK